MASILGEGCMLPSGKQKRAHLAMRLSLGDNQLYVKVNSSR